MAANLQTDQRASLRDLAQKANAARENGQLKDAREYCLKILEIHPKMESAMHMLGDVSLHLGHLDESQRVLKQLIALNPGNPDYLNALGRVYDAQNRYQEAIEFFRKGLAIDNRNSLIYANLGVVYKKIGNWKKSCEAFANAVRQNPHHLGFQNEFVGSLMNYEFNFFNAGVKDVMHICLQNDDLEHKYIAVTFRAFFTFDPAYEGLRALGDCKSFEEALTVFEKLDITQAIQDKFLQLALKKLLVPNFVLETAMTHLRRIALRNASHTQSFQMLAENKNFFFALADQCWLNEYIYFYSDEEKELVQQLKEDLEADFSHSESDTVLKLLLLACYEPLHKLENAKAILQVYENTEDEDLAKLVITQIKEPLEEFDIRKTITSFGKVSDQISLAVQDQYEEHPYPRWKSVSMVYNETDSAQQDILIAGCGTGKQCIAAGALFPNSRIHSVDLSRSSLSYAIRKAREYGMHHLTFEQADILDLADLDRKFDRIFCTGVLHHMKDPSAGLAVLKKLLKPKGKLFLGLYSEAARQSAAAVQDYIKENGYQAKPDDIRRFRKEFFDHENEDLKEFYLYSDSYSLSTCRDLLFHVQEHRYTIPKLQTLLEENDVSFLQFQILSENNLALFRERFPEEGAELDLQNWEIFEQEHPGLFAAMYSFWACHDSDYEHFKKKITYA